MLREGQGHTPDGSPSVVPSANGEVQPKGSEASGDQPKSATPADTELVGLTHRQVEQAVHERLGWTHEGMVQAFARHHAWLMDADAVEWSAPRLPTVCHDHA